MASDAVSEEREKWERCATLLGGRIDKREQYLVMEYGNAANPGVVPVGSGAVFDLEWRDRILALAERAERAEALIRVYVEWLDESQANRSISDAMRALLSDLDAREKAGREA